MRTERGVWTMLTLVIKPTEYCNADCAYCVVRDKHEKREVMSVRTLTRLLERIDEYLRIDPLRRVNLTWHGGEPALLGTRFYRALQALGAEIFAERAQQISHAVQSNVTLVDDELAAAWAALGVRGVGTSYEYVPGVRRLAQDEDSARYVASFFRGVAALQRHGIAVGVIYVVTAHTVRAPVETMVFLANLLGKRGLGHFRVNPMTVEGEARHDRNRSLAISPEQFGHFLGQAYRYWYPRRNLLAGVAPFRGACAVLQRGDCSLLGCEEAGTCVSDHLGVSARGEIYQCGRAIDNAILRYGDVFSSSLAAALDSSGKRELRLRLTRLAQTECCDCPHWSLCHGGCPVDGYIHTGDWHHRTHLCQARRVFLDDYAVPLHLASSASAASGSGRLLAEKA